MHMLVLISVCFLTSLSVSVQDEDPNIKMHDLVEAYHKGGWWHGVISGLRNPVTGQYTVSFPYYREIFQFQMSEIKPHLTYVSGFPF